jgi:hypothetical protein
MKCFQIRSHRNWPPSDWPQAEISSGVESALQAPRHKVEQYNAIPPATKSAVLLVIEYAQKR